MSNADTRKALARMIGFERAEFEMQYEGEQIAAFDRETIICSVQALLRWSYPELVKASERSCYAPENMAANRIVTAQFMALCDSQRRYGLRILPNPKAAS